MKRTARGRFETSLDDEDWTVHSDGRRWTVIYLGEHDDGPCVSPYWMPPGYVGPVHHHPTDTMAVVVSGSMKMGSRTYRAGDCRMQSAGSVYGPEEAGPEGCYVINIFADRSGMFPWEHGKDGPSGDWRSVKPQLTLKDDSAATKDSR